MHLRRLSSSMTRTMAERSERAAATSRLTWSTPTSTVRRTLVDINGIHGLAFIREAEGVLRIGALTREAELEESALIRTRYPLLHDTCQVIADPLVRNLATLGGNLAHGDPANDHPATML